MKIKLLFLLSFVVFVGKIQLSFSMELSSIKTRDFTQEGFVIEHLIPDKNPDIIHIALSKENKKYVYSYYPNTKEIIECKDTINDEELEIFTKSNPTSLPEKSMPYTLKSKDSTFAEIWHIATQKKIGDVQHGSTIKKSLFTRDATQLVTASDKVVKVWRLKGPIRFKCGDDTVSIEATDRNLDILNMSQVIKSMFGDLGNDIGISNESIPLRGINNEQDFKFIFGIMKSIYENEKIVNIDPLLDSYKKKGLMAGPRPDSTTFKKNLIDYYYSGDIKKNLMNWSVDVLCTFLMACNILDISNKEIHSTEIIGEIIAGKYKKNKNESIVNQLPKELQNLIARYRIRGCFFDIDKWWGVNGVNLAEKKAELLQNLTMQQSDLIVSISSCISMRSERKTIFVDSEAYKTLNTFLANARAYLEQCIEVKDVREPDLLTFFNGPFINKKFLWGGVLSAGALIATASLFCFYKYFKYLPTFI